ncbi:MAG TPA: TetR/AcrR family transcriptional regulator [Polyangiaceae bacterium]|jgi:AcrR family transcriptional regulator
MKAPAPARTRLEPEARRAQLVEVAAKLLARGGVEALQFTELAAAAGVTRPVVYKFFPTREALVQAILDDFEGELARRFENAAVARAATSLAEATGAFIEAICDTIEAKGSGAWELLGAQGPDARVAELGREVQARLMKPWRRSIAQATGASRREVETVTAMLVAAGRAVLSRWYAGELSRTEAARDATRGVSALLAAFTKAPKR